MAEDGTPWAWVNEILQNLLDAEEWPQFRGPDEKPIWFASLEFVILQVEAYWAYAVQEKSVKEIADSQDISEKAAWKRVEKVRNWISVSITGGYRWSDRIKVVGELMDNDNLTRDEALRAMTINEPTLRMFRKKSRRNKSQGLEILDRI